MNSDERQVRKASQKAQPHVGDPETLVKVDSPDDFSYEGEITSQTSAAAKTTMRAQTTMTSQAMSEIPAKKRSGSLRGQSGNNTK